MINKKFKAYRKESTHLCGECKNFEYCSQTQVKNTQYETDYCLWGNDRFEVKNA